jgi:hypothetical protein
VIVTVSVVVASLHPPVPVTVYVIVVVPALTPVTTPVEELMVATAVFEELHVPVALFPEMESVVVPVMVVVRVPEIVPALGAAVTVMSMDAVSASHPPDPARM